jgi:hypothetical protein
MSALIIQLIGRMRVIFCSACVLAGLFVTGCGSSEATSKILSTSSDDPTSAVLTPTSISTTYEAPTPLSTEELLTAKDQWGKLFKSLERCSDAADTNCYQNAGIGSLNGSPIAAALYCDYKQYGTGQWACDWMINFYEYSDARWLSSGSIQSQLHEMFDGAFFAEMTGDNNSELFFSVMYVSFTEAEVFGFKGDQWSPLTFDGQTVLYMGHFNSKTGKIESGVSLDMGKPCDYRRWTSLIYTWRGKEFKSWRGLDSNGKSISVEEAQRCGA